MKKAERIEYLKQKRTDFQKHLLLEKKREQLNLFITEINELEPKLVTVTHLKIDTSSIASPTLYDIPKPPVHRKLKYRTPDDEQKVNKMLLTWIEQQGHQRVLTGNEFLIDSDDWLEINASSLVKYFDLLFNKLALLYTIMIAPGNGNFITSFEFESEVIIYSGNMNGKEIKYYS